MSSDDDMGVDAGANLLPGEPRSFGSGRYVVRKRLGAGNFATVYLAYDERLDVAVAVKLLSDRWSWEPEVRGRFVQEARLLRSLNTPHVVQIRDIAETEDGRPYLVMDFATHGTLEQRLVALAQRGLRPDVGQLRMIASALADSLAFLHDRRIAHRDIKPSNVLITADGPSSVPSVPSGSSGDDDAAAKVGLLLRPGERIMLGDLGLAKNLSLDSGITVGVGTAGYMAPEQSLAGAKIDTRTDIFAVSAMFAQIASGESPDPVRRYAAGAVTSGRPLSPSIPAALARALAHGLDTDPGARPQTIHEWHAEVDAALSQAESAPLPSTAAPTTSVAPHGRRRTVVGGAIAVAVLLIAGIALIATRDDAGERAADVTEASAATVVDTSTASPAVTTGSPTTVPDGPFVDITGPVRTGIGDETVWNVMSADVVSGNWSLTGPVQPSPDTWAPGDGFRGVWNVEGTFTLTLTAIASDGSTVTDSLTFRVS